jgi:DNA-binding transcriptional LysR family regulator
MEHLTSMAIFAKVVDEKSFSAAASRLGLAKSTVSKSVSRLERRRGAQLLNRTTRRLSLTEAGSAFYQSCARIVSEAETAEAEIGRLSETPCGMLKVNASMVFGTRHIAPAVAAFLSSHPDIHLDLTMTDQFVDLVEDGYDLAIRIGTMANSSMIARKLAPCRFVLCAAPDYVAREGVPSAPEDLAHHVCLRYAYQATQDSWRLAGPEGERSIRVTGPFRANNGDALRIAAVSGFGIIFAPTFLVADDLQAGRLEIVLSDHTWDSGVYAIYPETRLLSAKSRAFVDFLAARFGPEPSWERELKLAATG